MSLEIRPLALQGGPRDVFSRLRERRRIALLESAQLMPGLAAWSYIAGPAPGLLETRGDLTTLSINGSVIKRWQDPFRALAEVLGRLRISTGDAAGESGNGPEFSGGLVGYLAYDLVRAIERLPARLAANPALPEMRLLLADHVLAYEHARNRWSMTSLDLPWTDATQRRRAWQATLEQAGTVGRATPESDFKAGVLASRTPAAQYLADVARCIEYIRAGDIFQVNLSHRLEGGFEGDPFALYQALAAANPAPFGAYIEGDEGALASLSPERFLKLARSSVEARPIKGTRARSPEPQEDARQRALLAASDKDRAENLMIVDLMRNDLGRVARIGSVRVDELWKIEAHPSVWQMVSSIRAELRDGVGPAELVRACWPPGSMTGAPKVRAMQIIEELEPVRRGPYAGAIGYFDVRGGMDLSVVIRTALCAAARVMLQLGGAVVADSRPEDELEESLAKGRLLMRALGADSGASGREKQER